MSDIIEDAADDEEEFSLEKLFVCEEYVEKSWQFAEDCQQSLLCSNMSSTDHDLTGQIVWPASLLLCYFVCNSRPLFKGKHVLEVGAGCGLGGFIAAKYCSRSVITDGNDIVIRLLDKNKKYAEHNNVDVLTLKWGFQEEVNAYCAEYGAPDVIIGADVIMWPTFTRPLLYTLLWLLSKRPTESACYISYIVRAHSTTKLLYSVVAELGLVIEEIPVDSFYENVEGNGLYSLEKHMLKIKLSDKLVQDIQSGVVNSSAAMPDGFENYNSPC